jgi:periplasmic divalent cation tolerance protein
MEERFAVIMKTGRSADMGGKPNVSRILPPLRPVKGSELESGRKEGAEGRIQSVAEIGGMKRETSYRVVLVTCATLEEARKIARAVVEKHLAACVNIVTHAVESFYTWEGKLENSSEYLLMMKTSEERLSELQKEVISLHSYDTPEFVVLAIVAGSEEYLKWLGESVGELKS